jgi:hypothetical protein
VVEGAALEKRCAVFPYREFESPPLRHINKSSVTLDLLMCDKPRLLLRYRNKRLIDPVEMRANQCFVWVPDLLGLFVGKRRHFEQNYDKHG